MFGTLRVCQSMNSMFLFKSLGDGIFTSHCGNMLADRVWGLKSVETITLGAQIMGISSGLSGLGRAVDQTRKSPSRHLLITDQLRTAPPCGSKNDLQEQNVQPKGSPVWG